MAVGLKGLTAKDRADWEKKYSSYLQGKSPEEIDRMYKNEMFKAKFKGRSDYDSLKQLSPAERDNFYNKYYTDSINALKKSNQTYNAITGNSLQVKSDATRVQDPIKYNLSKAEQKAFRDRSIAYDAAMRKYNSTYAKSAFDRDHAVKDIRTVADNISPYYRKYKNTDYLPFTDRDWQGMAAEYNAQRDTYGERSANLWLQGKIQDTASKNQSILEKAWNGFTGMGASAAGAAIGAFGMLKGAFDYATGNYHKVKGLNGFENFVNSIMDNDITRYGNDITKYGTILNLDKAKKAGLPENEVIQTQAQQSEEGSLVDQIFNVNTLPIAMQSGGFTLASMAAGFGEAKVAGLAFRLAKGATMAGKVGSTTQKLMQARNALNVIQKAENFTNKFVIPGLTGSIEGVSEGLNTKLDVLEDSKQKIADAQAKYVDQRFKELYEKEYSKRMQEAYNKSKFTRNRETGKMTSSFNPDRESRRILNDLYNQAWNEYAPKYQESLEQAEFAASRAGVNNFLVNSAINGVINQTLKAGLQAPSVKGTLQKSRLFNWAHPKGKFSISGTGESLSVTPKYGILKKALNIAKEPAGEFTEEYLQSVSNDMMSGGAKNNIHQFIENKYNGDGTAQVGDYMAGDISAAFKAMGESLISNETIKSGIYGALSSAMGTPSFSPRNYTKTVIGKDGKYHTKIDLSRREGESRAEHIARLMPWRSGISNAISENKETQRKLYDDAKTLETWLKDPTNKAKFDGVVGTYNWAKQMDSKAKSNDEFGYRNSALGKTINDAIMLDKIKGTPYYDSFMKELITAANLEEGTQEANDYIKSMRDNVNTNDNDVSDSDILKQIKDNANKMLDTMNSIQEESDKIDRTLGNVDEDTKQALIFGQLSLQDWDKRSKQINDELNQITPDIVDNSIPSSNMTKETRDIISRFGSLEKAKETKKKLSDSAEKIQKDIDNLNNRKDNLTDTEKKILKEKKVKLKSLDKIIDSIGDLENINEESTVLNEAEIMALPAIERATMLSKENLSNYSKKQQEIINNLIEKGTAKDIDFYNKIQDAGRIDLASRAFLTQYNEILRDPDSFNMYVQRARQAAADVLTKKKFESIEGIEDYKDFALKMDKLMDSGTPREQRLIINALSKSNNPNYERYQRDRKTLEGLFNQVVNDDAFKNIDANDADMFALSLQYLSNNGIDLDDENAVVNALSEKDEDGNSLLQKYVDEINNDSPEETRVVFTSVGEAIQTYKDIMKNYKRDEKEKEDNSRPVKAENTTSDKSAPAKPVSPFAGVFKTAATSPEENDRDIARSIEDESIQPGRPKAKPIVTEKEGKEQKTTEETEGGNTTVLDRNHPEDHIFINYSDQGIHDLTKKADWSSKNVGDPRIGRGKNGASWGKYKNAYYYSKPVGGRNDYLAIWFKDEPNEAQKKAIEELVNNPEYSSRFPEDFQSLIIDALNNNSSATSSQEDNGAAKENASDLDNKNNEFRENSNERVAKGAELGVKTIRNSSKSYSNEAKSEAENILNGFSKNEFENTDELSDALVQKANQIETKAEENDDKSTQVASLLKQAAAKIKNMPKEEKKTEKEEGPTKTPSFFDRTKSKVERTNRAFFNSENMPNPNSSTLESSDIQWLRSKYPNNPIVKYWDRYKIEDYLSSDKLKTGKNSTKVYFITDDTLANEISSYMQSSGASYTNLDTPIIAVVEDKDGPLSIGDKRYQPIGTFPSTNSTRYRGASNIGRIRDLLGNQKSGELIKDNNGTILEGSLIGISAPKVERVYKPDPNINAQNLAFDTLSPEEKEELKGVEKRFRYSNPIYAKLKKMFLGMIEYKKSTDRKSKGYYYINVSNLKGDLLDFRIFYRPISNTLSKNSNKSIVELFNENNVNELLSANSRLAKASSILDNLASSFPDTASEDSPITLNNLEPTGETAELLNGLSARLTKEMTRQLSFPNRNWRYTITPTAEILDDGRRMFSINITDGDTIIPLGKITNGKMSDDAKFEILKNLIMDGTQTRKSGDFDFIKWQVDEPNDNEPINKTATNVARAFDDGILDMSVKSIRYRAKGVTVRSPFTSSGATVKSDEVTNKSNATSSGPVNAPTISATDQVQSGKAIIDSETGTILEGEKENKNNKGESIKTVVNSLKEDSKVIQKSPDGNGYVNTQTGKRYTSIDSIISKNERQDSPDVTFLSNIEEAVKEFTRDFFDGEFTDKEGNLLADYSYDYANATDNQWKRFAVELKPYRNGLVVNDGLTIVTGNNVITGTLNVTDSKGQVHTIDIAVKPDLLAYDKDGNFYISMIKVVKNPSDKNNPISQEEINRLTKELSLCQKLLESTYGVKVKGLSIKPVEVNYPDINDTDSYSASDDNQLSVNNKEFRDAKPNTLSQINVGYEDPNIQYDNVNANNKDQVSNIEKAINNNDTSVDQNNTSTPETKDVKVDKVEVAENNNTTVDLNTGLNIGKVRDRRRKKPGARKVNPKPTRMVPSRLAWGIWDDFLLDDGTPLWKEETQKALEALGYTEDSWNKLSDEEMEHELKCKGVSWSVPL